MNSIDKSWVDTHIDSNGEVVIPEGVQRIEKGAFEGNDKLKKIIMPNSINFIGPRAFSDCPNLQEVSFSSNLQVLGQNSFRNCPQLRQVDIPSNVKIIYPGTFDGNTSLESISLSGKLEYLSADAFSNCDNLKEVHIAGIERIDYNAFMGKRNINKITIDGQEFVLGDNEQLFSIQKVGEKVALVKQSKDNGKFSTQCINLDKNTSKTIGNNVYLTDDGKMCYAINSLANTSLNVLEQFKKSGLSQLYIYGGENEITPDQHSVGMNFNLYNIDDLIQVKSQIEEIKKKIVIPNAKEPGREKKIYGQIVKILSDNMQYDEVEVDDVARLSNRNLLSMLKGEAVCQGYIEVLRNISAEYGIQVKPIRGSIPLNGKKSAHEWSQVKLDGIWYDDDFTNYREALSKNDLDSCYCFLIGTRTDGIAHTKHVGYETRSKLYNVGKTMSLGDKKILLSYSRVQQQAQQQSVQPHEKERPPEESIKDEVGDEFKPKNQEQKQQEQEATTEWMNRIGTVAQEVDKTNAGVNGKQEVAQLIKDLDKKQQKEQNKEQEEQQQDI